MTATSERTVVTATGERAHRRSCLGRGPNALRWPLAATILASTGCVIIPLGSAGPSVPATRAHARGIRTLVYAQDGTVLLSASRDGPVILWNARTRQPIGAPIVGERKGLRAATLSPDGAWVGAGNQDGSVVLWDTERRQPGEIQLSGRHRRAVSSVAFSPDGRVLASGSEDGTVLFWDVRTRTEIGRIPSNGRGVGRVAFSADGTIVAVATSREITLHDGRTHRPLDRPRLSTTSALEEIAFSRDGSLLARTGGGFSLWDVAGGRCVWGSEPGCTPPTQSLNHRAGVAISPDGRFLATGARGGEPIVELWDIGWKRSFAVLAGHGSKRWGAAMFAGNSAGAGAFTTTFIHAVAFSPDGTVLATGGDDGAIIFWDAATREPIAPPGQ